MNLSSIGLLLAGMAVYPAYVYALTEWGGVPIESFVWMGSLAVPPLAMPFVGALWFGAIHLEGRE